MDASLSLYGMLGLEEGDAHVIRNAGGVITDDEIRSLVISQRLLGTREIVLIHHTGCGMLTFSDDEVKQQIQDDVGIKPHFSMESFSDLEENVRQSMARIQASPSSRTKTPCAGLSTRSRRAACERYLTRQLESPADRVIIGADSPKLRRWLHSCYGGLTRTR